MCHISFSLIFQIKTNLTSCFFYNFLHKFSKCCFSIPFSALNSSTHFNTPKLRLAAKNIPFLQRRQRRRMSKKLPFSTLFVHAGA